MFIFAEEVHFEQITAGVDPQEIVISSDDVTPSAFYTIARSVQGSRVDVVINDGSTNSSQGTYNSILCRKVEVRYSLGGFFKIHFALINLVTLELDKIGLKRVIKVNVSGFGFNNLKNPFPRRL